ncbi:MAG: ABC transporter ATP-binding protein [Dehalococcoidales bacterium]|nr:ABC transporter ATP-binding protein [Dehalococcoidales bacterium]
MPSITLKNISNYACRSVDLEINDKEFLVVLGPNGSGKTTLLNTIAGHVEYRGNVLFDDVSVDRVPANKRGVGYLFQNLALFPHLDVAANIAYSLKIQKWPRKKIQQRVSELVELVNIEYLVSRYPAYISGGEKQRVALARALAASPGVLLLDEPLSSLDAQTAKYLRTELKQIQRRLGITTIYVTHDLMEAVNMADRMAIILDGKIEQADEPEKLMFFPCNERVSDFIGAPNILDCEYCKSTEQGVMEVGCGGLKIFVPHDGGEIHKIAILPRHVYVSDNKPRGPGVNSFLAKIIEIIPRNDTVRIRLEMGSNKLVAELSRQIFEEMDLETGKEVHVILRMRRIRPFENRHINGRKELS